jgi:hypothetical protein
VPSVVIESRYRPNGRKPLAPNACGEDKRTAEGLEDDPALVPLETLPGRGHY